MEHSNQEAFAAFADLADTAWKLRNALLQTKSFSLMVVQLEDAVLKIEESLAQLEADLQRGSRGQ